MNKLTVKLAPGFRTQYLKKFQFYYLTKKDSPRDCKSS